MKNGMDTQLNTPLPNNALGMQEMIKRARKIYDDLKSALEAEYLGKYLAIEIKSGQYFIGDTREEATKEANKVFPKAIIFIRKIGSIDKVARDYSFPIFDQSGYERIF